MSGLGIDPLVTHEVKAPHQRTWVSGTYDSRKSTIIRRRRCGQRVGRQILSLRGITTDRVTIEPAEITATSV
jgi:hypothetical protein